jgi:hypothetical protein
MEPDNIFRIEYYINDILLMPSKEVIKVNPLLDSEIAEFYVKELTENYIKKKYELI